MPKKALGQNFLFDLNLTAKIARTAGPIEDTTVIEVGPGPGGLTRALLASGAKKVIAIERDTRALPALNDIAKLYPNQLHIIEGDALKIDYASLCDGHTVIAANLPYNIATPLLIGWLTASSTPLPYSSLTLMFQKEVAERIVAKPGSKNYGRLSIISGWRTKARIAFDISPQAFVPPPKVTSSLVHLDIRQSPEPCDMVTLQKIVATAFGQRRKMLRSSLKSLGVDTISLLNRAELSPESRAEQLEISDFVHLSNIYDQYYK